ncbi:MAG: hypothetical protein J5J00_01215, partial [Deltaproteobacteria bacterium]|nr:hypothetical protein [Deltaproteobacteria bacterium]
MKPDASLRAKISFAPLGCFRPVLLTILTALVVVSPSSAFAVCPDGVIDMGETCDDNNMTNGDGCSDTCAVEAGWACSGAPSTCALFTPTPTETPTPTATDTATATPT